MAEEMPTQPTPEPTAPDPTAEQSLEATSEKTAAPAVTVGTEQVVPPTILGIDEETAGQPMSPDELAEARANEVAFSWQASEYVHHHKGTGWYAGLAAVIAVLVGLAVWLKLWLTIGAFLAMAAAIVVYARRPPRTLMYELSQGGIKIEGKEYPYSEFRSFGVLKDEDWHTIDLEPTKRFNPRLSILFDTDDFDAIVGHLELHLPREDRDPDVIERVSRWVRF